MNFDLQNQLMVADAQTGGATVSSNSYQKQSAAQDISIGRRMALLFMATVAAGAGSSWLLEAIQADNAALTTNVNAISNITVLAASLIPGNQFEVPLPQGSLNQTFIGARATGTGGTTTVTLDCYLMPQDEIQRFKSFVNVTPVNV